MVDVVVVGFDWEEDDETDETIWSDLALDEGGPDADVDDVDCVLLDGVGVCTVELAAETEKKYILKKKKKIEI